LLVAAWAGWRYRFICGETGVGSVRRPIPSPSRYVDMFLEERLRKESRKAGLRWNRPRVHRSPVAFHFNANLW